MFTYHTIRPSYHDGINLCRITQAASLDDSEGILSLKTCRSLGCVLHHLHIIDLGSESIGIMIFATIEWIYKTMSRFFFINFIIAEIKKPDRLYYSLPDPGPRHLSRSSIHRPLENDLIWIPFNLVTSSKQDLHYYEPKIWYFDDGMAFWRSIALTRLAASFYILKIVIDFLSLEIHWLYINPESHPDQNLLQNRVEWPFRLMYPTEMQFHHTLEARSGVDPLDLIARCCG